MSMLGALGGALGVGFLTGGSSIGTGILGYIGQRETNRMNMQLGREQMDFQEQMSSSAYQRAVQDMQAAGLNPMLAYQQGGASSPQGAMPQVQSELGAGIASAMQGAQLQNISAQTSKLEAETEEVKARTPVHVAHEAESRQRVFQSIHEINKIIADTRLSESSAMLQGAEIQKLNAQIPEIKTHIEKMIEEVKNMKSSRAEIDQRVKANLPDMLRQLDQINIILKRYEETGARLNADAARGLLGSIDRVIRSLKGRLNP